ncbi:MAG TPA: serine/threonine-protein kinase [Gallionellaceae bacterium]|nr:serine/threonine-protein kinase [Gallionellaceae bacterium]
MNKLLFWKRDWFVGLLVVLAFLASANSDLMQSLEDKAYDLGVRYSSRTPSDKIAVIAIDDQSINNIGRWPWPREVQARMLDTLSAGHPKVIGNTTFFFEPQIDPGLNYIRRIKEFVDGSSLGGSAQADAVQLRSMLRDASESLDNDQKLSDSMAKAGDVALPMYFTLAEPEGKPDHPLPDYVQRNALTNVRHNGDARPLPSATAIVPIPILGEHAAAIGNLSTKPDADGGYREEPLVVQHFGQYYPSFSLLLAAKSLNLGPRDILVKLGEGVRLGRLFIPTDPTMLMRPFFYADRAYAGQEAKPAFQVDSFYDVLSGKIPADKYRGKIVLIGATATGVGAPQLTPISAGMPPVLALAHTISSILQQDYFVVPEWGMWAKWGIFLLIALYLILILPRLGAKMGVLITAILFVGMIGAHFELMIGRGMWLQLMLPASMLAVGFLLLDAKRFLVAERGKQRSDAESAESNRMLGLAFQGQGQLDMAFDKLRKVPVDDSLMEVLYNLGLDFERKRQFNKAESVFRYMADYNPKFRDLGERIAQTRAMSETVVLGGSGRSNASTLVLDKAGVAKPMLGRYEVEKELGKGAMGVVYLGKDPKIGRVVAIKTLALSQEFEADELEDVKARFFREAETAGRLSHPNIVTMYDAGEEQDLAFIAMEFLKGRDLAAYTKPDNLLPIPKVLDIAARVADALAYAHTLNVVHRDIKPHNIMYDPETDAVKVTDFGIARITDSSKTKTGMVLGTPSYMSPEQLAGQRIEGRSDLFSLGVSLYQLICGTLPFQGESLAQLMFRIANEPHGNILKIRPDVPRCVVKIINKALDKDVEKRYQSGAEMAEALRRCAGSLRGEK